jgi:hypothetical protein
MGKLSDFGSARNVELGLTQTALPVTALYAAPELLNGESGTEKSDVYSFALLAFELETGKSVFDARTPILKLGSDIQSDKRPSLPGRMHAVLKSIVERGWKADPAKRPTIAEICAELQQVDWRVFDGADARRVKTEAAGLPLSRSAPKELLLARLSEAQARVRELERELATRAAPTGRALPLGAGGSWRAHSGAVTQLPPFAGEWLFDGNPTAIRPVILPADVTSLPPQAFCGCFHLRKITFPSKFKVVSAEAFRDCATLTKFSFPMGFTTIGCGAFCDCVGLKKVCLQAGLSTIGAHAFQGCSALARITLPAGLPTIDDCAFQLCTGLKQVVFPPDLVSLGRQAFLGCFGLTQLTLPATLTSIGASAFHFCKGLKEVTMPPRMTRILELTFCGCEGLTKVVLPAALESIGECAFELCRGLKQLEFPATLKWIHHCAFSGCGLTEVVLPAEFWNLKLSAFRFCDLRRLEIGTNVRGIGDDWHQCRHFGNAM